MARVTKFISNVVNDKLGSRLENPYQDFTLADLGTEEDWSQILTLGLAPYLAELIAQTCVSGLDEKYPGMSAVRRR
ncbi:hypothetical protein [Rhodococcus sp. TAF43]|uniref:hypothetical protein n=1 Tax=Rhodococcus sp. TAF43 TaxID=3237483 RepID=UPI003F98418D